MVVVIKSISDVEVGLLAAAHAARAERHVLRLAGAGGTVPPAHAAHLGQHRPG